MPTYITAVASVDGGYSVLELELARRIAADDPMVEDAWLEGRSLMAEFQTDGEGASREPIRVSRKLAEQMQH